MVRFLKKKFSEEGLFFAALFLAVITSFMVTPRWRAINLHVIFALFSLMLISSAFEKHRLLEALSIGLLRRLKNERTIGAVMILITAGLAMLMTNDVALMSVVPLTLALGGEGAFDPFKIIVLETAAANIGSSLTPFGNPQNLYLYAFYQMTPGVFFKIMIGFSAMGLSLLLLIHLTAASKVIETKMKAIAIEQPRRLGLYGIVFFLVLVSILRGANIVFSTVIAATTVLALDRDLFRKADYYLLGTFAAFFIVIDNVTRMDAVHQNIQTLVNTPINAYLVSVMLSQVISNVPAAILVSAFTDYGKSVLLGVSVGGLGTLIASLANLIAYRIYARKYPGKRYLHYFYWVNIPLLLLMTLVMAKYVQIAT